MKHLDRVNMCTVGCDCKYCSLEDHNNNNGSHCLEPPVIHHLHTGHLPKLTRPWRLPGPSWWPLSTPLLRCIPRGHLLSSTEAYRLDEMKNGILACVWGFWFVRFFYPESSVPRRQWAAAFLSYIPGAWRPLRMYSLLTNLNLSWLSKYLHCQKKIHSLSNN